MASKPPKLSRREREILDILLELREASAEDVRTRLSNPPSNSAARALLSRLEKKGVISHIERDLRYVYVPAVSREAAKETALSRLVRVFYEGSLASAVTGMVEQSSADMTDEELAEIESAIQEARRKRQQ